MTNTMLSETEFLEHMSASYGMPLDEYLEQAGVKGMKWGRRKATSDSDAPTKTRSELRGLNKASRKADNVTRNAEIDGARERFNSGTARSDYKSAKATYKSQKQVVGSREAKKAFQKVKDKNFADYDKSQEVKAGKETAIVAVAAVAAFAIGAFLR